MLRMARAPEREKQAYYDDHNDHSAYMADWSQDDGSWYSDPWDDFYGTYWSWSEDPWWYGEADYGYGTFYGVQYDTSWYDADWYDDAKAACDDSTSP